MHYARTAIHPRQRAPAPPIPLADPLPASYSYLSAGSSLLSLLKLTYYRIFACVYGWCGGCAHVVMANSSWTRRHLAALFRQGPLWRRLQLWLRSGSDGAGGGGGGGGDGAPQLVYPPCDTEHLLALPLDR
jgi:alpha-1,2-mannosyltransferase